MQLCSVMACGNEAVIKDTAASEFWIITSFYCTECYATLIGKPDDIHIDGSRVIFEPRQADQSTDLLPSDHPGR